MQMIVFPRTRPADKIRKIGSLNKIRLKHNTGKPFLFYDSAALYAGTLIRKIFQEVVRLFWHEKR